VTRPFRFAVQAIEARSAQQWHELARRTEGLGYSTLFLADHYLGPGPAHDKAHTPIQHVAPIAAMTSAATVTSTLKVGCRVFCVDYHVPAALAKEAATIDLLSDGRLEFGIGAGWSPHEYEAMGLTFGPPGERVAKLREVVALFKAHCAGAVLDEHGTHAKAIGYEGLPLPVQRPHPPVMIGGGKPRVLAYAAQEADIVSINNVPFEPVNADGLTPALEAERRIGWVREAGGERLAAVDVEASPYFIRVTDDPAAAAAEITKYVKYPAEQLIDHPNVLIGSVEQIVDRLQERRERFGPNYISVQQSQLDAFAPVVARLSEK
jgi:probable F420-dependent oxidoreductase